MASTIDGLIYKPVTPELTKKFHDMKPLRGDRKLNKARTKEIKSALIDGSFRTAVWASVFCKVDGIEYRLNGHHTTTALLDLLKEGRFPVGLQFAIERYEADTLADCARLYATFDPRISSRKPGEVVRSFLENSELEGLIPRVGLLCSTAIAFEEHGRQYAVKTSPQQRAESCIREPEFAFWMNAILGERATASRCLRRGPVATAMLHSWRSSPEAATLFWTLVRDGISSNPKSPDRKLRDYLLSVNISHGRGASGDKKAVDELEIQDKCIRLWESWRSSRKRLRPTSHESVSADC